jgi:hypothetical protein
MGGKGQERLSFLLLSQEFGKSGDSVAHGKGRRRSKEAGPPREPRPLAPDPVTGRESWVATDDWAAYQLEKASAGRFYLSVLPLPPARLWQRHHRLSGNAIFRWVLTFLPGAIVASDTPAENGKATFV